MVRSVSSADADRSRLRLSRARRLTGMSTNPSRCETLWWSLSGCRSRSESSGCSETKKAAAPFKSTRSKRNSVFPWRRRSNSARSSASSTAPVSPPRRLGVGGASKASVVVSPIPISAAKRHRTAGPNQQAGSLLPNLGSVLPAFARHTDMLSGGTSSPTRQMLHHHGSTPSYVVTTDA